MYAIRSYYGFIATRYHSLVVAADTLPECLKVTAWTELADGSPDEIMGFEHREHNVHGVITSYSIHYTKLYDFR